MPTNLNSYKIRLEKQLDDITTELKSIGIYDALSDRWEALPDPEESAADADENDSADFTEEWDGRRAVLSTLEHEYHDIKRALNKLEQGTYGKCEVGGEPIEEKRLQARPDARTCIAHMNEENQLPL